MEHLLKSIADVLSLCLSAVAILVVAIGSIEALINIVRVMLVRRSSHVDKSAVWLKFAHWLIAALTFQLAADIIETSITTRWEAVARLGVTAVIRTFLNYFLEKDLTETRELQRESESRIRDARV